jgi:hypothetical protein
MESKSPGRGCSMGLEDWSNGNDANEWNDNRKKRWFGGDDAPGDDDC